MGTTSDGPARSVHGRVGRVHLISDATAGRAIDVGRARILQSKVVTTHPLGMVADFAAVHLKEHLQIEVIHPDDFVMDLVDLNEKRAVAAFRELRARKKNPPWATVELVERLRNAGLIQTSLWLRTQDVSALV